MSFLCIKSLIGLPEQSEKVCLRVGEIEHERPSSRHEQQMNPDNGLEDPPGRGLLDGLSLLIGKGGRVGRRGNTKPLFRPAAAPARLWPGGGGSSREKTLVSLGDHRS